MAKSSFLLVSLQEDQAKELAQLVTNDTCRKILNYLADKESTTETEVSNDLSLALSTVHYNLQNLLKANLLVVEEYHYSKKGKEILHYKLANKYIIIAPKSTFGLKQKLKGILPVGALLLGVGAIIHLLQRTMSFGASMADFAVAPAALMAEESIRAAPKMVAENMDAVASGASSGGASAASAGIQEQALAAAPEAINETFQAIPVIIQSSAGHPALWFIVGGIFVMVLWMLGSYIFYRLKS